MRAAIYNPYLDTLGGGERYTLSFAKVLLERGWDVDLAWSDEGIKDKFEKRFGIPLDKLNIVSDIKNGEGYDLCFWVSDGSIPLLHSRKNIIHFQVPFTTPDGKSLLNRMKFIRVNAIVCNSLFTKNIIDQTYGVRSLVLYPPVDTDKFARAKKENTILNVGRFSSLLQAKRQDVLISAFAKMIRYKKLKGWKMVLAGGAEVGADNVLEKLQKQAKNLPVRFVVGPDLQTLIKLYKSSKVFWSASGFGVDESKNPERVEHFGITTVEAMAAGCVPIIYNAGGAKEIIQNEQNGYLWHNTNELVDNTDELIKNNDLRTKISKNAIESSERFSLKSFEEQVLEIVK